MKTVFIAHPIGGDVHGNVQKVLSICKQIHSSTLIPVAPYIASVQYLEDGNGYERALGVAGNMETLRRGYVDEVWLYGDRISYGMKEEVLLALELGIPVFAHTPETAHDLTAVVKEWWLSQQEK